MQQPSISFDSQDVFQDTNTDIIGPDSSFDMLLRDYDDLDLDLTQSLDLQPLANINKPAHSDFQISQFQPWSQTSENSQSVCSEVDIIPQIPLPSLLPTKSDHVLIPRVSMVPSTSSSLLIHDSVDIIPTVDVVIPNIKRTPVSIAEQIRRFRDPLSSLSSTMSGIVSSKQTIIPQNSIHNTISHNETAQNITPCRTSQSDRAGTVRYKGK